MSKKFYIVNIERDDRGAESKPALFDNLDNAIAMVQEVAGMELDWHYIDNLMEACWLGDDADPDDWDCASEWYAHIWELDGLTTKLEWC